MSNPTPEKTSVADALREWGFDVKAFEARARKSLDTARGDLTEINGAVRQTLMQTKEVLVNLLENARNAEARRVTVQVAASGRQLVVADDGRGVPPEALPRVFEPTFSTTSSGAGLGLAISRRLVESWGGVITLESEPGKGTRVTLTLQTAS